jgi:hypothetical protein
MATLQIICLCVGLVGIGFVGGRWFERRSPPTEFGIELANEVWNECPKTAHCFPPGVKGPYER